MAVAHSAASESHTGTTGSTNQAAFSWTHTQTGTPQGVLVFVHTISASDFITSVTYGGTALTRVAGAVAIDATVEPGRTDMFFLGSGLASGNQTITVNRTNNATIMYASAATVTAGADVNVTGIQVEEDNQSLAPVAIDDGSSGIDSLRYAATYYGANSPAPAGTGSTLLTSIDLGSFGNSMVRETTAGQGARNVGFSAASDDVAAVYVAVREVTAWSTTGDTGSFTLTGNAADLAVVSPKLLDAVVGTFTLTGNPVDFARQYSVTIDAGGFALSGNDATLGHNVKIDGGTGSFSLTGNDVTLTVAGGLNNYSLPVDAGSFALAGGQPSLRRSYALTADTGALVLTGNPVTLSDTDQLEAATGTFALTGGNPVLSRTYYLSGGTGSFTETGQPVTLTRSRLLDPLVGTFSLTGNATTFRRSYNVSAVSGTFALTGNPVALTTLGAVEIDPIRGTFALTGNAATFSKTSALQADRGTFTLQGQPATFTVGRTVQCATGTFNLTGNGATFTADRALFASTGSFALVGNPVSFVIGGNRQISVDRGEFLLTGNPATTAAGRRLYPDPETFALTGQNVTLNRTYNITVTPGNYTLTGADVDLYVPRKLDLPVLPGIFQLTGPVPSFSKTSRRRNILIF